MGRRLSITGCCRRCYNLCLFINDWLLSPDSGGDLKGGGFQRARNGEVTYQYQHQPSLHPSRCSRRHPSRSPRRKSHYEGPTRSPSLQPGRDWCRRRTEASCRRPAGSGQKLRKYAQPPRPQWTHLSHTVCHAAPQRKRVPVVIQKDATGKRAAQALRVGRPLARVSGARTRFFLVLFNFPLPLSRFLIVSKSKGGSSGWHGAFALGERAVLAG